MDILLRKLKEQAGESIGETLVALLVMCLAMIVITGGIVTSARINHRATEFKTVSSLDLSDTVESEAATVNVSGGGTSETKSDVTIDVVLYTDKANSDSKDYFKFYELKKKASDSGS